MSPQELNGLIEHLNATHSDVFIVLKRLFVSLVATGGRPDQSPIAPVVCYVDVNAAAIELGVTRKTLLNWSHAGRITIVHDGRSKLIPLLDLERIKATRSR